MRVVSRFDRLYRDNFHFVWAAAHRCGTPADCVDDVVQDVFVTAYRRLDELRWEISPHGWLYGVTRRVSFRYRRSAARTARRRTAVAAESNRSSRPHHQQDAARALEAMLGQLEDTQRETFVLAELLGMSGPEIAAELSIPLNTVYSRLRLARKRLMGLAGSEQKLQSEISTTRDADKPSQAQSERTYAALMPLVGSSWLPIKASIAAGLKSAALPLAAASVALTAYVITSATSKGTRGTEEIVAASKQAHEQHPPAPKPAPKDEDAVVAEAGVAPARQPPGDTTPSSARPAGAPATTTVTSKAPPPADTLAAEVGLLDKARASLDRGDWATALAVLDEHSTKFSNGQLAEARNATRFRALCKAGRTVEAETVALALHQAQPNSNLAQQTPTKCPTP